MALGGALGLVLVAGDAAALCVVASTFPWFSLGTFDLIHLSSSVMVCCGV